MTGSNLAMVPVQTVATGLDGTSGSGTVDFTCPDVTPNSAIYFYQFSQAGQPTSWTTRFTIAGADGSTVSPFVHREVIQQQLTPFPRADSSYAIHERHRMGHRLARRRIGIGRLVGGRGRRCGCEHLPRDRPLAQCRRDWRIGPRIARRVFVGSLGRHRDERDLAVVRDVLQQRRTRLDRHDDFLALVVRLVLFVGIGCGSVVVLLDHPQQQRRLDPRLVRRVRPRRRRPRPGRLKRHALQDNAHNLHVSAVSGDGHYGSIPSSSSSWSVYTHAPRYPSPSRSNSSPSVCNSYPRSYRTERGRQSFSSPWKAV